MGPATRRLDLPSSRRPTWYGQGPSIGFRADRSYHTGNEEDERAGPGPTIEVDPDSWEAVSSTWATSPRVAEGYRYLITAVDGTVTHLIAGDRIPGNIDVDPPAVIATQATSEVEYGFSGDRDGCRRNIALSSFAKSWDATVRNRVVRWQRCSRL